MSPDADPTEAARQGQWGAAGAFFWPSPAKRIGSISLAEHLAIIGHALRHDKLLGSMGVMLQIKNVPEDVHRVLKARAALAGLSLTEYARSTLEQAARRPSREELVAELSRIDPVDAGESVEEALAHIRDDLA